MWTFELVATGRKQPVISEKNKLKIGPWSQSNIEAQKLLSQEWPDCAARMAQNTQDEVDFHV